LLQPTRDTPPFVDPETLAPFAAAFEAMLRRLRHESSRAGAESQTPTEGLLRVHVGRDEPLHLRYSFEETTRLTDHSVALQPMHEGHAAVTVLFTDVSAGEAAKELVRRRYELSYNLHGEQRMRGDDAQVAALVGSLSVW